MSVVELCGLGYSYRPGQDCISGIDLSVDEGEILTVLGFNGSGKTTLLRCICGELACVGEVRLQGKSISEYSLLELSRLVAYMPQSAEYLPSMPVFDFVVLGRLPYMNVYARPGEQDREIAVSCMEQLEVDGFASKRLGELSGGELQRVRLAQAIAKRGSILLLDEPASMLDIDRQAALLGILKKLQGQGQTVIFTTHDPNHALLLGSRVVLLKRAGGMMTGPICDSVITDALCREYGRHLQTIDDRNCDRRVFGLQL